MSDRAPRFVVPLPMMPADHYLPMAAAAEANGFAAIAVSDSVFFPEKVSAAYPYTDSGERFWPADTPFLDPVVAVAAMAAVTSRIRFYTNVMKVPLRNPLLLAKQVASLAALSHDRFSLGVGLSWIPEEFAWCGTDMRTRGARTDEIIEILRGVCAGGGPRWVEHHGTHYHFDRLMISPAPSTPVPILVGGHSPPALRRAARLGDGWISVNTTAEELARILPALEQRRREEGTADRPFEVHVMPVDTFDVDGYRRLADAGATHIQAVPWFFYGGDPADLSVQVDSLSRFADTVISAFG